MHVNGYYDLTTKSVSSDLSGGDAGLNLPPIVAGESVLFEIRFRKQIDGTPQEVQPNVRAMRAVMGTVDSLPRSGGFKLSVDAETTPSQIPFLGSGAHRLALMAERIRVSVEALDGVGAGNTLVEVRDSSIVIVFDDYLQHEILIVENRLHPVSFIRVRAYERGGVWEHELRFLKAPVAHTSTFELQTGALPEVTALRDGGSEEDTVWSEIQRLYIPPSFSGTFRVVRDGTLRSGPIGRKAKTEEIAAAMDPLADSGGFFTVTNPIDHVAYLEFDGDMKGTDYPLLTTEVFDPPNPTHVILLDTKTRALADEMMAVQSMTMTLEVWAEIESEKTEGEYNWNCLFRRNVTVNEAVDWDELATAPDEDWLMPPSFISWKAFSPSQVANGQIHYATELGDGLLKVFSVAHGLDTLLVDVILLDNTVPGARHVLGTDYSWVRNSENQITLTWLGEDAPAANSLNVVVLGLELTSFFDPHTHVIGDIDGLSDWMDLVGSRLVALEAVIPGRITGLPVSGAALEVPLPDILDVLPTRRLKRGTPLPDKLDDLARAEADLAGLLRKGGLLPALAATAEELPADPGSPADPLNLGRVFENTGSVKRLGAAPGEFVASDGRRWYRVAQSGIAGNWYPVEMERLLWSVGINDRQFPAGRTLTAKFGVEVMLLKTRHAASWTLRVEYGTLIEGEDFTDDNLEHVDWGVADPLLEQRIIVTHIPQRHDVTLRIRHRIEEEESVFLSEADYYRQRVTGSAVLPGANFAIRAKLCEFDTEDASPAGGYALVRGLFVPAPGESGELPATITIL